MGEGPSQDTFVLVGANHRSAPLSLRDALFAEDADIPAILNDLGLDQAMYLATCDRVEIISYGDLEALAPSMLSFLAERAGIEHAALEPQTYVKSGESLIRHLFAVASGLDSLVIGEPQVLGQVKAAHRIARETGKIGQELDGLLQATFAAAKRVRGETKIGERPVSLAAAAVAVGRDMFGDFKNNTAVLLGDGDMGQLVAESFIKAGVGHLLVSAPRPARALALARQFDVPSAPYDDLIWLLSQADVALIALSAPLPAIDAPRVQAALKKRKRKPMLILDLSIPGDVDAAVERVDDAFLYDLDDLERVAEEGISHRVRESQAAWTLIDEEVAAYLKDQAGRAAAPLIVRLRSHFEAERERALVEAGGDAARATQLMMNRLLHAPSEALRGQEALTAAERLLEEIFGLKDEEKNG
ncbi:Glutamyl-tRNA reductase [Rhodospirillaceae bacterium LM-1]|nr:Glutamyl-tRNA reductase [Rhodospirillaceae bacterium LM-1]